MSRILAIDYGTKRIGLAVTDPQRIIATALATISGNEIMKYLDTYLQKEKVETIIIGYPKTLAGTVSATAKLVQSFVSVLKKKFPAMPIELVDERFTSLIAQRSLIESGQRKKTRRDKSVLDKISAVIILQSYLDQQTLRNTIS